MHIITMIVFLSILILVHEFGHFGVARLFKIKVDRFGFGLPFGPTLYETTWKDVKVCVHAFLLGGYVAFPDDDPESDLPEDDPGRISNRPVWQRFCVVSAGVAANAVIAYLIVLMVVAFSGGISSGKFKVLVDELQPDKSLPVHQTNLRAKDRIISANGVSINSPIIFQELTRRSKKFDGYVTEAQTNKQIEDLRKANNASLNNLNPDQIISKGIKISLVKNNYEKPLTVENDSFVGVSKYNPEGQKLTQKQEKLRNSLENKNYYISDGATTLEDLASATGDTSHPIYITVNRSGKDIKLAPVYPNKQGIIGIKLLSEEIIVPAKGPVSTVKGSWDFLYRNTYYMIAGLGKIITGEIPLSDMHGIVAITKVGSDIIQKKGIWDGLLLMALISMDLAIVNLLPIPALDGGHLLFLLIEKLIGRPVKQETQENFARAGFVFLIGLMILIIFNDIFALVTDKL